MSLNIRVLKDFNAFLDGENYAGKCKTVQPPKLANILEDFRGGGMLGNDKVRMGYESLEAEITMGSWEPSVLKKVAHMAGSSLLVFRGAIVNERANTTEACVITMEGFISEGDLGSFESGKLGELKFPFKCHSYKLEVGGEVLYDIDIQAGRAVIGGVDQYEAIASALQLSI